MNTWSRIISLMTVFVLVIGCSPQEKPAPTPPVVQTPSKPTPWQTEADVRASVTRLGDEVTAVTPYQGQYLLVESRDKYNNQRFRFANLKTHDIDLLPTVPYEVKLVKIKDENNILFEADGTNSINMFSVFPFLIECRRYVEVADVNGEFFAFESPRYFSISEPSSAIGKGVPMFATDMRVTLDGVQLLFGPVEGKESGFYAATAFIPSTHITYNQEDNELVVRLSSSRIGAALKEAWNDRPLSNCFVRSCTYREHDDYTEIIIGLTETAQFYYADVIILDPFYIIDHAEMPILMVSFRAAIR